MIDDHPSLIPERYSLVMFDCADDATPLGFVGTVAFARVDGVLFSIVLMMMMLLLLFLCLTRGFTLVCSVVLVDEALFRIRWWVVVMFALLAVALGFTLYG